MTPHQTLTLSQATWLYGTSDTTALNTRFANDAKALGYGIQLRAVALPDSILIVYLQCKDSIQQKTSNIKTLQLAIRSVKNPDNVSS